MQVHIEMSILTDALRITMKKRDLNKKKLLSRTHIYPWVHLIFLFIQTELNS